MKNIELIDNNGLPPIGSTEADFKIKSVAYERIKSFQVLAHHCGRAVIAARDYPRSEYEERSKWHELTFVPYAIKKNYFIQIRNHIGEANEKAVTESDWPDEKRIDVVATNGNDGLHYAAKAPEFKFGAGAFNLVDDSPKTAADYLAACANVQLERGRQYDASGTGERSFDAAAEAFNCVTGKNLRGSDVCLILEMVKLVRQYSDPTRLHADSVLDKVSYSALWAEQITAEIGK